MISAAEKKRRLKNLRDRNRRFAKMPPDRQRIAIARDVLAQLDAKRFVARSTYLQILGGTPPQPYNGWTERYTDAENVDLSEVTACADKCQVCGIGSVFVAAVERADRLKLKKLEVGSGGMPRVNRSQMITYLRPWFSHEQLDRIEDVFELHDCPRRWQILTPENRLRRIMENIIENSGEFILPAEEG